MQISNKFERYTEFDPLVPIWCVTPNKGGVIHRFFDTSPFSPSGRYLALFRVPYEDRLPSPGDRGEIVVIDLQEGVEKVVATTCGWEHQLGANINWGKDDNQIIYNDVDTATWQVHGIRLDLEKDEKTRLEHGVYHVSHDGMEACTGNPASKWRTQAGYGAIVPKEYSPVVRMLSEDEGLFVNNTSTGKGKLLLSMKQIFEQCFTKDYIDKNKDGECYLFHSKYSPSGQKIMFSTRWIDSKYHDHLNAIGADIIKFNVFTCNRDGSNLRLSISEEHWANGGHHTTFHPDEEHLTMNIKKDWDKMRFAIATLDDKEISRVFNDVVGSGHPTFHPNGKFILTDTYVNELVDYGDGTIPIRVIHLSDSREEMVARINTYSKHQSVDGTLRVDPHPAWDRTNRYVAINAFVDGTRRVFVMDMKKYL